MMMEMIQLQKFFFCVIGFLCVGFNDRIGFIVVQSIDGFEIVYSDGIFILRRVVK